MLDVMNAPMDPPLASDIIVALTVATADVLEHTSEVEPDLAGDLASFGEN